MKSPILWTLVVAAWLFSGDAARAEVNSSNDAARPAEQAFGGAAVGDSKSGLDNPSKQAAAEPETANQSATADSDTANPQSSAVLPASRFSGRAAEAYQAAGTYPNLMRHLLSRGVDDVKAEQVSLYDCFTSDYAATHTLCQDEAIEARRMHENGIPLAEIQKAIDHKIGPQYSFLRDTPIKSALHPDEQSLLPVREAPKQTLTRTDQQLTNLWQKVTESGALQEALGKTVTALPEFDRAKLLTAILTIAVTPDPTRVFDLGKSDMPPLLVSESALVLLVQNKGQTGPFMTLTSRAVELVTQYTEYVRKNSELQRTSQFLTETQSVLPTEQRAVELNGRPPELQPHLLTIESDTATKSARTKLEHCKQELADARKSLVEICGEEAVARLEQSLNSPQAPASPIH